MIVGTQQLAELLNLDSRTVQRLEKEEIFKKSAPGKWNVEENIKRFVAHEKAKVERQWQKKYQELQEKVQEEDPDYRLKLAKAMREELELERDMQRIVYVEDVEKYMQALAQVVLQAYEKIPKRIGKSLIDGKQRRKIQEEVKKEIDSAFEEIRKANIPQKFAAQAKFGEEGE